ncbi:LuxR C-terminal-related transcriptional regulator [Hymenobacter sp. ASUV-10]|uniref:LuxR C-terminal-related transcriptional regulator n=1 Tax=Hymenobacter aranciens TaxID=3063996 RepID=A0ABT9BKE8_9BACT|nr:LuxR family transcriptional regulator [Hymenobacter sp. ASUV-10]MDO7877482.1 LuxR C-terminal-related transcriptional regulator [Hymenobacter sp. ASUV-10]
MTDEELITKKIAEIAAAADQYPTVVIIHHVPTQTVRYLSEWGLRLLGATLEELQALGPAFSPTYFNPVESDEYMARVFQLMYESGVPDVHTFYQQVRTTEREGWSWYLTSMRRLLANDRGEPLLVIGLAIPLHPDNHFAAKVKRLIDENGFMRRHARLFATLSAREREVLRQLAVGKSAGEIAEELFISTETANTHRRNVRRKLAATTTFELAEYARAFDLI